MNASPLKAVVFDFDGVLVESVEVKLGAYGRLFAEQEGEDAYEAVTQFCAPRLGLSRFRLIKTVGEELFQRPVGEADLAGLCTRFSELVVEQVVAAPAVVGALEFLTSHVGRYRLFVISGTPESELQSILERRGMSRLFEAAFGSPATKEELFDRLCASCNLSPREILYVGDSTHDWLAVQRRQIPFIWRRRSLDSPRPEGYAGPALDTLADLARYLPG